VELEEVVDNRILRGGRKAGSANMRIIAAVVFSILFGLAGCQRTADTTPERRIQGGDADRGRQLVQDHGCTGCHIIPGVQRPDSLVGPPLTNWAERRLIAGRFPNQPDYLIEWIMAPQSMIPGSGMPDLGVPEHEARDIAAYLYSITD
jgi:cytochrome c